jgi:poly(hydroxyalkanoate) depolymerase family esterase
VRLKIQTTCSEIETMTDQEDNSSIVADPALEPEPGWTVFNPFPALKVVTSFVSGEPNGERIRIRYFLRQGDNALVGKVWFGPGTEGPPSHAHGGSIAAVLDETMGGAAWFAGYPVVASKLSVEYRRMLPLGSVVTVEATVTAVDGKKITTHARLLDANDKAYAEATGLFVIIPLERFGKLGEQAGSAIQSGLHLSHKHPHGDSSAPLLQKRLDVQEFRTRFRRPASFCRRNCGRGRPASHGERIAPRDELGWRTQMSWKQILLIVAMATILPGHPTRAKAGDWASGRVSNSSGSRSYMLWVPSGYDRRKSLPLLVLLHGCTQKPEDLAAISSMNEVAEKNGFLVVYPEQTAEANPLRCWNWFDPKHQSRGSGEPSLLAAVVQQIRASYTVDAQRVYVAGISAGGAMAVVMGVNYPDIFAGIGTIAGTEFKAATSAESGLTAMKQGGADPKKQGLLAFDAMGENSSATRRRMPVIVFHGSADPYLHPLNADQVIVQWAKTNDYLDDGRDNNSVSDQPAKTTEGSVPGGHSYAKYIYLDGAGRLLMEKWIVKGMGHAWPGSLAAGPFADSKAPRASEEMWRFFREATWDSAKPAPPKAVKPKKASLMRSAS